MNGTIRKQYEITKEDDGWVTVSTPTLDRDKDRVLPLGLELQNYERNPVLMWGHNYSAPFAVIGRAEELQLTDSAFKLKPAFRDPVNDQDPMTIIRALWDADLVRAFSIGFIPKEWEDNDDGGRDFTRAEILEVSLVPIPANQEALRNAVKALGDEPEGSQTVTLTCSMCGEAYEASATLAAFNLTGVAAQLCEKCVASFEQYMNQDPTQKPFPNEHACRLRSPGDFQSDSFRRVNRESDGKRYGVIMGRLTGEETMTEQAYRYPKDVWAVGEARSHCKEHGGQTFEPAEGQESLDDDGVRTVVCSCSVCGSDMRISPSVAAFCLSADIPKLCETCAKEVPGDDPTPPNTPPPEELDAPEEVGEEAVLEVITELLDVVESELLPEKE